MARSHQAAMNLDDQAADRYVQKCWKLSFSIQARAVDSLLAGNGSSRWRAFPRTRLFFFKRSQRIFSGFAALVLPVASDLDNSPRRPRPPRR